MNKVYQRIAQEVRSAVDKQVIYNREYLRERLFVHPDYRYLTLQYW